MSKTSCTLVPEINGKPSKLYLDLQKWQPESRPFVNYVYACYSQPAVQQAMDNAGYQRNDQAQHSVKDIRSFLDLDTLINESQSAGNAELSLGVIDINGNRIDFPDAQIALQKADDFNNTHKGLIASVIQHGNVYNIAVWEKNADTFTLESFVKTRLKAWDAALQTFNAVGIDLQSLPADVKSVINPYNIHFVSYLKNLQSVPLSGLYKKDALLLFSLSLNSPQVQRLVQRFGSIEAAAQMVHDINTGVPVTVSSADKIRLRSAIDYCKKFQNVDLDALQDEITQITQDIPDSLGETALNKTLHQLYKQFGIDKTELILTNNKIRSLSEVVGNEVIALQRKIRQLEKQEGHNAEGRNLSTLLNSLLRELQNKKYFAGTMNFLQSAANYITEIDNMLSNLPQTGSELEKAMATAEVLQQIKQLREQYYPLISALSREDLIIDESISKQDIDTLRQEAARLKKIFDDKDNVINTLTQNTMIKIMTQIVGNTTADGMNIANVIKMATKDSSMFDWLYGVGEQSNPIISAMGTIIRNAQKSRDVALKDISLRIRRATDKLYKSGSTSEFMYEDDGHIISDIDWSLYEAARSQEIKSLYAQGLRGFDLKEAIELWEEQNTEDRVVDTVSGRTEKVPNKYYKKQFPVLTSEQQEYYNEMMQLKGEIGTLLPEYARQQYLPPQLRRKMLDALGHAKSSKDVFNALWHKVENIWVIREDDDEYSKNAIIGGQEHEVVDSNFDNTPLRSIPIFYVKKLKDQDELLKNFSTGLQALAGTAVNYDAMNRVVQTVEFMGSFVKDQIPTEKADVVETASVKIAKYLRKFGRNNNATAIIDGFIDQHFYGMTLKESQQKSWTKIAKNLIGYTSFKGLVTNFKGMMSNLLGGIYQIFVEAGCGEFFNFKDLAFASTKLFGTAGVAGDFMELLTNNISHKAVLFRQIFDPMQESFEQSSHHRYYKSMFRQLLSHDLSFLGYGAGEYVIHLLPMYAILHHNKVLLNGKKIPLYDAFELSPIENGNAELTVKQGTTTLDGSPINQEYINEIRNTIQYVNQAMHGAMNTEDKGIIHQYMLGRAAMNFRQWMVRHYSRRFRARHFDSNKSMREGYWVSLYKFIQSEDTKEAFQDKQFFIAIWGFLKDIGTCLFRAKATWSTLKEDQKYNVKRVCSEIVIFTSLICLSFALGEPDDHKREFWRRWWIYQTRRLITEAEAASPTPYAFMSNITIFNSPIASINTLNSLTYILTGLDDIGKEIKSGPHRGENLYWRNVKKYTLPFYKDFEQMQKLSEDEALFNIGQNNNLSNY